MRSLVYDSHAPDAWDGNKNMLPPIRIRYMNEDVAAIRIRFQIHQHPYQVSRFDGRSRSSMGNLIMFGKNVFYGIINFHHSETSALFWRRCCWMLRGLS